jgi:hypothetical protein
VMSKCSSNRILVAGWRISNRSIILTLLLLRSQAVLHLFGSRAAKAVNPRPLLLWKMMPVHLRMPARPISYDESGMVNDGLRMPLPVRLDRHPQQLPCSCPVLTSEQREVQVRKWFGNPLGYPWPELFPPANGIRLSLTFRINSTSRLTIRAAQPNARMRSDPAR